MNDSAILVEDQPSTLSHILGAAISISCLPGIFGNIYVCCVEAATGLLTSQNSSMYKLSFSLTLADTFHLCLLAFYLGPASALQSWLGPNTWTRRIPGTLLMFNWYSALFSLCALAVNRYAAVCKPYQYSTAFSSSRTKLILAGIWIGAAILCIIGEFLVPCCELYMYYKIYSYSFLETDFNYNNYLIIIPVNTFTSIFVFVLYGFVIYNVHAANTRVSDSITSDRQRRRRVKEVRYAVQLVMISGVFVSVWVIFNICAQSIPGDQAFSGPFSSVVFLEVINGSANSIVYIIFNKDINRPLARLLTCFKDGASSIVVNFSKSGTVASSKFKGNPIQQTRTIEVQPGAE